jgi:hypothetical protein
MAAETSGSENCHRSICGSTASILLDAKAIVREKSLETNIDIHVYNSLVAFALRPFERSQYFATTTDAA